MNPSSPIRWPEVTAVFGGTFDPPHRGHVEAVRGLFKDPGVRQVIVIPSATPPHKPSIASAKQRAEMAEIAFSSLPKADIRIDRRELEQAARSPDRPSYSHDTLQSLKKDFAHLAFVIGTDQLTQLDRWYRFPEILGLCHWIVLERKPGGSEQARKPLQLWQGSGLIRAMDSITWNINQTSSVIKIIPTDAPEVSSTELREIIGLKKDLSSDVFLPDVLKYLKQNRLYGMSENE